jgi:hypothetical protein
LSGPGATIVVNTASASTSSPDVDLSNNSSSASVDIGSGAQGPASLPPPDPGEVNVTPAGGSGQCIQLRTAVGCQPLTQGMQVPLSQVAYVDPGKGAVELQGVEGLAIFYGTPFALNETTAPSSTGRAATRSVLELKLVGGNFSACKPKAAKGSKGSKGSKGAKGPKGSKGSRSTSGAAATRRPVRRLWGKGTGAFRTRGRYAAGTVRGTFWMTEDSCEGTLIRVNAGVVQVSDLPKKKIVNVPAGKSYFAAAPARTTSKAAKKNKTGKAKPAKKRAKKPAKR